jgi:carnitine O-palmitoyltransferase 1
MAHCFELALASELTQKEYRFDPLDGSVKARSMREEKEGDLLRTNSTACVLHLRDTVEEEEASLGGKRTSPAKFKPAMQLSWDISPALGEAIYASWARAKACIKDIDLVVRCHDAFGKGVIKKMKISPDACIQLALQVAYYRDQGSFCQTYESCMARLFLQGRTETIRTVCEESCAFVRALENPDVPAVEQQRLLRAAGERHQRYTREAMAGGGVDRHLFGLYVVAAGMGIDSPFLNKALSYKWNLSTSQVPPRQTVKNTWPNDDQGDVYYSPSGGFGPVSDEGYGVSYAIVGENRLFFHVSSKRSTAATSSSRFVDEIFRALKDIHAVNAAATASETR